jgi:fructoselysine and glucoselysine-specific PTS system IIA component
MRHIIVATHAHFAAGIAESLKLLAGTPVDMRTISAFVDGNDDVVKLAKSILDSFAPDDETVVCTDLLGGSVNNTFLNVIQRRSNVYLITNVNLPVLLTLVLTLNDEDNLEQMIRVLIASDGVRPKYCNDMLETSPNDEDF